MRYIVALLISGFVICAISLNVRQAERTIHERTRKALAEAKERGELPADFDLDQPKFTDMGMEMSSAEMQMIGLVDLWYALRMILIPLIIVVSLAIAWFTGTRSDQSTPHEVAHSLDS
ncbi:MAG: hypothetical protein U0941_25345 [Planctomycetaceae bacterium]